MIGRKQSEQGFFDRWSRTYDNPLVQAVTYRPVHDAVLRAIRQQKPQRVFDVGCGTGLLTLRLAKDVGADVIGCDYSKGMLDKASRHSRQLAWVQGDAMALPVATATVEAVVCTESFHWYPDQYGALREFGRVLVPGGRAYVATGPPTRGVTTLMAPWSRRFGHPPSMPTLESMSAMARSAGFLVIAQQRIVRLPLPSMLHILERPGSAAANG